MLYTLRSTYAANEHLLGNRIRFHQPSTSRYHHQSPSLLRSQPLRTGKTLEKGILESLRTGKTLEKGILKTLRTGKTLEKRKT